MEDVEAEALLAEIALTEQNSAEAVDLLLERWQRTNLFLPFWASRAYPSSGLWASLGPQACACASKKPKENEERKLTDRTWQAYFSYVAWGSRGTDENINSGESKDDASDSSDLHMIQGAVKNDEDVQCSHKNIEISN